jgi:hypothetical protein
VSKKRDLKALAVLGDKIFKKFEPVIDEPEVCQNYSSSNFNDRFIQPNE